MWLESLFRGLQLARLTRRPQGRAKHGVYCREKISAAEIAVLETLKRGSDWRLQDGADDLIHLISNSGGQASEPESSIFNPKNAHYILKDGC